MLKALHFGWTDETWETSDSPIEDNIEENPEKTDKQKYRALKKKQARDALLDLANEYKAGEFDA